ncbi:MAG: DNA-directed RNA polymerase subunit alpha C-terminal domain-containing protein [Anaerolineae bacterium]
MLRQQIEALDLGDHIHKLLVDAGMVRIGDLLKKMEEGEAALQSIEGLGARAIREIKERLQMLGLITE